LEERVAAHRQENVEIAGRPAARARLAFARERGRSCVFAPGRNVDLQGLIAAHPALAGATTARFVDHLAGAMAGVTSPLDSKDGLPSPHATMALAGRAGLCLGAGFRATAMAGLAGDRARHAHR